MHYNTVQLQDHVLQSIYIAHPSLPNTTYIQNTTYNAYYHYNMIHWMLVVLFHKSLGMVESTTVMVVPSSNTNYSTWKTSCKMTLIRDALWEIVNETSWRHAQVKFVATHERSLATVVLVIKPSLLYLTSSNLTTSVVALKTLANNHFQCKTWANELELNRSCSS